MNAYAMSETASGDSTAALIRKNITASTAEPPWPIITRCSNDSLIPLVCAISVRRSQAQFATPARSDAGITT